jgi:hypothetical protein
MSDAQIRFAYRSSALTLAASDENRLPSTLDKRFRLAILVISGIALLKS